MPSPKILIVEDELLIGKDMALRLSKMGYEVFDIAQNANEALSVLKEKEVDICLLDVNLGNSMDGITLAHQINKMFNLPFIYVTSYSDDATVQRAKDTQPSAYILKPFNETELKIAIDVAIHNYSLGKIAATIKEDSQVKEAETFQVDQSIFIRKKERFEKINFQDILWAEAKGNYTIIHSVNDQYLIANTLQLITEQLVAPFFARIHRSYFVNLNAVDSIDGNTLYINDRAFTISRSHREEILQRFNMI